MRFQIRGVLECYVSKLELTQFLLWEVDYFSINVPEKIPLYLGLST
jgi:hypothetical protein